MSTLFLLLALAMTIAGGTFIGNYAKSHLLGTGIIMVAVGLIFGMGAAALLILPAISH